MPKKPKRLFRFVVQREYMAESIDEARMMFGGQLKLAVKEAAPHLVARVVRARYASRAERLAQAVQQLEEAQGAVEELKDEVEGWYDGLPENFQQGDKGSALEECKSQLEQVMEAIDAAVSDAQGVDFPGTYS